MQFSAFIQVAYASPFDRADMDEYVGAVGVRLDESKALCCIEPLHCAGRQMRSS